MGASSITFTKGSDWWLSRCSASGRERYPERIRVGKLDKPRIYVPERTCHPMVADDGVSAWGAYCSECGYRFAGPYGNRNVPEHMATRRDIMPRYCPECGARVEVNDGDR